MTSVDWLALDPQHWLVAWTSSASDLQNLVSELQAESVRTPVRLLRGEQMRRLKGLHKHFARGLEFPKYEGRWAPNYVANWGSLSDTLQDLTWFYEQGLVLAITDAAQLLAEAPDRELEFLADVLLNARDNWRHPVFERDVRDEPRPFTVVLQDSEQGLRSLAARAPTFADLLAQLP